MPGLVFFQLVGPDVQQKTDALQSSSTRREKANSQHNASGARLQTTADAARIVPLYETPRRPSKSVCHAGLVPWPPRSEDGLLTRRFRCA
jgi:hypothetical protein